MRYVTEIIIAWTHDRIIVPKNEGDKEQLKDHDDLFSMQNTQITKR